MAAGISIEVALEIDKAEAAANELEDQFVSSMRAAASKGEAAFVKFANASEKELRDLASKAREQARAIADSRSKMAGDLIGFLGDAKDFFGMAAKGLLGLSDATTTAITKTADMTEKGAQLGMTFGGPVGAAIGAASGFLLGWVTASKEAEQAEIALTNKLASEASKRIEIRRKEARSLGKDIEVVKDEVEGLIEEASDTIDKINETGNKKLKGKALAAFPSQEGFKKAADDLIAKQEELKKLNETGLSERRRLLSGNLKSMEDMTGDELKQADETAAKFIEDRKKELQDEIEVARDGYDKYKKEIQKGLKSVNKELDAGNKKIAAAAKIAAADKTTTDEEASAIFEKTLIDQREQWRLQDIESMFMQRDAEIAIKDEIYQADLALFDLQQRLRIEDLNAERAIASEKKAIFDQQQAERIAGFTILTDQMMTLTQAVTGQISDNIEAGNKAFGSMGIAARRGISEVLKSFAKQWTAKAFGEIAESLASLAIGDFRGAGLHALAATEYGVAAAAAGAGGARAARKANGGQSSTSSAGGGGLGRNSGSSAPTTTVQTPTIVNIQSLTPGDQRAWEYAQQAIAKANRGGR